MRADPGEHKEALGECESLGLHPRICANDSEDTHHSDFPISDEDRAIGWAIAYFIGKVPSIEGVETSYDGKRMPFESLSSADQWTIVARALRLHGLSIADGRGVANGCVK